MNLKQLSDQLGLSQTTVSRALNNYPEVNEDTRERVKLAARKFNYRPNARASGLATGRTKTIGHIIPMNSTEVFNPIFGEFIAGASQAYSKRGYELSLTMAKEDSEEVIYREIASKGSVDGVIVHAPRVKDPRITLLQQLRLPFVIHGRDFSNQSEYSWIDMNNRRAFYRATKLLIDLGHENICLVNGRESLNFAWRRRQGYIDALGDEQINVSAELMYSGDLTEANGYDAACTALAQQVRPTAFLVASYVGALGVRRAIHQAGLEMGSDISVIIHDDELSYFQNDGDIPQFTATRSSVRDAGERAAMMLLDIIDQPDKAPLTELLDAPLTIGASTGPVKK
ncbi:LacI family transcriptional regulator [Chromatiales bacterium (ex Bugula neritina AB1)]|nr:LacI family transcriptional regulator [Chromatiales bacterium (ex Bugula neritina AB1)]